MSIINRSIRFRELTKHSTRSKPLRVRLRSCLALITGAETGVSGESMSRAIACDLPSTYRTMN